MKISLSLSPPSGCIHPCTPRRSSGLATGKGETEAQSGVGLHLRSTQGSMAKAVSCLPHTSTSPLPAPLTSRPMGHGRKLAPGSPRCKTYLERGEGPWAWGRRQLCWEPAKCFHSLSTVWTSNLFNQLRWGRAKQGRRSSLARRGAEPAGGPSVLCRLPSPSRAQGRVPRRPRRGAGQPPRTGERRAARPPSRGFLPLVGGLAAGPGPGGEGEAPVLVCRGRTGPARVSVRALPVRATAVPRG